jgi:hypothetical protein
MMIWNNVRSQLNKRVSDGCVVFMLCLWRVFVSCRRRVFCVVVVVSASFFLLLLFDWWSVVVVSVSFPA